MTRLLLAVLGGVVVAALVVVAIMFSTRKAERSAGTSPVGWSALGLAGLTAAFIAVAYLFTPEYATEAEAQVEGASTGFDPQSLYMVGTLTGVAAGVLGVLALRRGDRHWPSWAGLVAGAAVVGSWAFVIVWIMFNPY